jgi:glycosyltransferase involved in cell wall biosynthesis
MISVVIPLYQKAAYIGRAVDSVLAQTYPDFELIVLDDGSTDGGAEVVRRYADPRIRLLSQANCGASAARNRGVREASSELIAFLDADDEWEPDFLQTVLALHDRFPDAAVFGTAWRLVYEEGQVVDPDFHGRLPLPGEVGIIDYFGGSAGNSPLHSSGVMVKKAALAEVGGFPEDVVYGEDHDTWIRLALRYPVAWHYRVCLSVHLGNRCDQYMYVGNFAFSRSVKAFLHAGGELLHPGQVHEYLARRHTSLLINNWLGGKPEIMREIVADCRTIPGFRTRCFRWYLLSWIPYPVIKFIWTTRRRIKGRSGELPRFKSIYRSTDETELIADPLRLQVHKLPKGR